MEKTKWTEDGFEYVASGVRGGTGGGKGPHESVSWESMVRQRRAERVKLWALAIICAAWFIYRVVIFLACLTFLLACLTFLLAFWGLWWLLFGGGLTLFGPR